MAIKFADKKPEASGKTKATVEARFATPIEAPDPVNPDPSSDDPLSKPSAAEKKARKRR